MNRFGSRVYTTPVAASGGVAPVPVFLGGSEETGSPAGHTASFNIGAAKNNRRILVFGQSQVEGDTVSGVTVGGIALVQKYSGVPASGKQAIIYSGLVDTGSGSQNVVVGWATGAFNYRLMHVWSLPLAASAVYVASTGTSAVVTTLLSVIPGDVVIGFGMSGSGVNADFTSGSTMAPNGTNIVGNSNGAHWEIAVTNAAFQIATNGGNVAAIVAHYSY